MLEGLLVDLEPISSEFYDEKMHAFWNGESRLWATMGENQPTTRAEIKRVIERRAGGRERGYTGVHFMMRAKDGAVIGTIGLNWVNQWHRFSWLGAWIGEADYWSGGHGTDALLSVADYAFDWLDMRRLIAMTLGTNIRAQRNLEKCSFTLEERVREGAFVNGAFEDALTYGILREEWPGRAALVETMGLRAKAEARYGKVE